MIAQKRSGGPGGISRLNTGCQYSRTLDQQVKSLSLHLTKPPARVFGFALFWVIEVSECYGNRRTYF